METVIPKYKHLANNPKYSIIDTDVILHQTPGGMLSNLVNQLKGMGALDKLDEVFRLLPKVRKDLGQVPLVTPTSQIVGVQTVNNVLFDSYEGEYANITEQVKDLCYGLYGKTPLPINEELRKKALKNYPRGEQHITVRPGSVLEPEMPKVREEVKGLAKDLDDELVYALYPVTGKRFLRWKYGIEEVPADVKPKTLEDVRKEEELVAKALSGELTAKKEPGDMREMEVFVDGEKFNVSIPDIKIAPTAGGRAKRVKKEPTERKKEVSSGALLAPIPGMLVEYRKKNGDVVKAGETVVVIEAMKMMNNFKAPIDGVISEINFKSGDAVAKNDVLFVVEPEK
ncbi:MAG: hypothetical protein PHX54_09055 [Lentimicrobiaceae bacterium]|nr:hypothetical protein [Lentimicrobiaceae bacterium]